MANMRFVLMYDSVFHVSTMSAESDFAIYTYAVAEMLHTHECLWLVG